VPLSGWRLARTLLPVALISGAMYGVVRAVAGAPIEPVGLRLLLEIAGGAGAYLLLSLLFRPEAFAEMLSIVRRQLRA
ncbi:MAG: lipopolysaccharide biosynthesis protein, partial [Alistipes sp.]|nr:lipopolysaccharide biosynthesis protein [Alistipes sp.]